MLLLTGHTERRATDHPLSCAAMIVLMHDLAADIGTAENRIRKLKKKAVSYDCSRYLDLQCLFQGNKKYQILLRRNSSLLALQSET